MTREQALENALRAIEPLILKAHKSAVNKAVYQPLEAALGEARVALALPPDGVNAEMLAALQWVFSCWEVGAWKNEDGETPDIEPVKAVLARASHIPMPSKTFNPPAQA